MAGAVVLSAVAANDYGTQDTRHQIMAKQLVGTAKFQVPGGQATPAPPVGTSLGKFGINLGQFVQQFNERTREAGGMPIPVVVNVYNDRSFDFVMQEPAGGGAVEAGGRHRQRFGRAEQGKGRQGDEGPARRDREDEDGRSQRHAIRIMPRRMIEGTARSMGFEVEGLERRA